MDLRLNKVLAKFAITTNSMVFEKKIKLKKHHLIAEKIRYLKE